jgi:hypothetical protein
MYSNDQKVSESELTRLTLIYISKTETNHRTIFNDQTQPKSGFFNSKLELNLNGKKPTAHLQLLHVYISQYATQNDRILHGQQLRHYSNMELIYTVH